MSSENDFYDMAVKIYVHLLASNKKYFRVRDLVKIFDEPNMTTYQLMEAIKFLQYEGKIQKWSQKTWEVVA